MFSNFFDMLAGAKPLPRHIGRHRGTPGRLALQEAQRAEREAEHAQAIVIADFMEFGWTREQAEAQL